MKNLIVALAVVVTSAVGAWAHSKCCGGSCCPGPCCAHAQQK